MSYDKKFEDLKRYVKMQTEEDVRLFDITVYELAQTKDPEVLEKLIDIFDDECEFPEVMYSLVHAIETYPDEIYIKGILNKVKDFKRYPEWFLSLFYGIFNNQLCLNLMKSNIHIADKTALLELLKIMYEESEEHRPIIDELRLILNKN